MVSRSEYGETTAAAEEEEVEEAGIGDDAATGLVITNTHTIARAWHFPTRA